MAKRYARSMKNKRGEKIYFADEVARQSIEDMGGGVVATAEICRSIVDELV